MSLLLLFQGGVQAESAPPAPTLPLDFLSHGDPAIAVGAQLTVADALGTAAVAGPASTQIDETGGLTTVGPGPTTTIQ